MTRFKKWLYVRYLPCDINRSRESEGWTISIRLHEKLSATLSNEGIPRFKEHFSETDWEFLVMEHIEGKTLREIQIASGKPSEVRDCMFWAMAICDLLTLEDVKQFIFNFPPIGYSTEMSRRGSKRLLHDASKGRRKRDFRAPSHSSESLRRVLGRWAFHSSSECRQKAFSLHSLQGSSDRVVQ